MPSRSGLEPRPNCYVAKGGDWPDGPLEDDAPFEAVLAQQVSLRLRDACRDLGLNTRQAAERAGISQTAVNNLLNGATWGGLPAIARTEQSFTGYCAGSAVHTQEPLSACL